MAVLRCDFYSDTLSLSTSMTVILPQPATTPTGLTGSAAAGPPPVLYLLHGLSDDHTTWLRSTSIERYVAPLGLAVVMPAVARSYYADEAYGGRFWTFLSEELPAIVQSFFAVSTRRQDTFVAGLSMGGYGAVKLALRQPERFAAAASLSGALDIAGGSTGRFRPEDPRMFARIFGDEPVAGTPADLMALVEDADPAQAPRLRLWCGDRDPLLPANRRFAEAARAAGLSVPLDITPGDHDWAYWDTHVQDALAWLPLPGRTST